MKYVLRISYYLSLKIKFKMCSLALPLMIGIAEFPSAHNDNRGVKISRRLCERQ